MEDSSFIDKSKIEKIIQEHFFSRKDVDVVYLFGSLVGVGYSEQSDIDIGVLYKPDCIPNYEQCVHEQSTLMDLLNREVDLITLNRATPVLSYQVLKYGVCVVCRNQRAANEFFVRTINEYFDLKTNRQVIERSLHEVRII